MDKYPNILYIAKCVDWPWKAYKQDKKQPNDVAYMRVDRLENMINSLKMIRDYDQNQPFYAQLNGIINSLERGTDKAGR